KLHCPWREAERGPDPYEEALKVGQDDKYERTGQTDIELTFASIRVARERGRRAINSIAPEKENKERLELIDKGELIEDDKKADTLEVVDSVAECKQAEVFKAKSRTRTETQTETSGTITDQALNRKSDKNIQRKEKCRIHGKIHKNGCSAGEKTRGSTVDREDSGTGPERR
ncbi:hypothetical protein PRIPAC_93844, partial [Pristionchus pacificus]|uniref:Uncharacterized protein n=1 Tax=Pristionchus pacificus TaxID=54126 RepID=A0A2A6B9X4_PRIPA